MTREVDDKEDSAPGHVKKILSYSIFTSSIEAVVCLWINAIQMLTYSLQWNAYTTIFSSYHYAHEPLKYVYNMPL